MMRVFADCAPEYSEAGLRVFPTGGDDGKKPLITNWRRVGKSAVKELIKKYPDANIGIIDGDNGGITRIDIDDPQLLGDCIREFGDTPVKVGTPSGGFHLWYKANAEKRIIGYQGEAIDILGFGGMGLAPPSVNPKKGSYRFLEGSVDDIGTLPCLPATIALESNKPALKPSKMNNGDGRNTKLFNKARTLAANVDDKDKFIEDVFKFNQLFNDPLGIEEVNKTLDSVWKYKQENRLLIPGCEAAAIIRRNEFEKLSDSPQALKLLTKLRLEHGWRNGGKFALTAATAKTLNINFRTFHKARKKLIDEGFIDVINPGQKQKRNATIVRLVA